ncbi:MAG: PAS domain S-box protein [bacterium]
MDFTKEKKAGWIMLKNTRETGDFRQIKITLQSILESTADGILAVDNKGKVINANRRFMDMWRIPKSLMNTGDDNILLDFVLSQLIEPDVFLKKVKFLYGTDREDMNMLYFKDGRIFERFSSPLMMGKEILGRVWSFRDITERKKTEESLQIQAQILENLSEGVNLADEKGNICFTNDKFDKMFGYEKGELIGKNVSVLSAYPGEESIKHVESIFGSVNVKGRWTGEILNKKKNGSVFFTRANVALIKIGDKTMFITVQGDITERKKNEEKLKASEEKYSTLVENGNDGIIILQDNALKYVNSIICKMTGFTREELIGKPFLNYVSPGYKKIVMERYEKRLEGHNVPSRYEIEIFAKDGGKTPVEINASLIMYEGKPASMAIIRDITERKKAEKAIGESEERYRNLIENINLGITLIDKNYKILMANSEFCRRTGFPKDKAEGKSCYEICAGRDSVCPDCPGTKTMALKKLVKTESEYLSYDGSPLPVIVHTFPVLDSNNEAKAFIEITEDISEYKKVEKAKKNLIRDLSHGLKTPVSMIEMSLGIIKNSMDSGDKESLMKAKRIAEENIRKVRKDLNGILYEFSMDVKKEILTKNKRVLKRASLKSAVKQAVKNIKSCLKAKNLKLNVKIPFGTDKVKIQTNDLKTLLDNLLDNAAKFTKKGGISVISRKKGNMVEIKVKDTGCGIFARDISRVFDKFYKRHASIEGTGLGLSICKELVEMYNGEITVLSEGVGKGTTVTVNLPKV